MTEKILITSALPYANGPLHFGHIAGAYLPGDCYARYERLKGNDVLYICGSDEYGVAITLSAEIAKCTPQEHVDKFHQINKDFFKKLDFSFDNYSRTTWEGHRETAQEFFTDLYNNGYIEEREEKHLYSPDEDKFLADRYVVGTCPKCGYEGARGDECQKCSSSYEATDLKNPRSKISGSKLILKPSTHWYLRFDKFKKDLKKWIANKEWKQNVLNFIKHYIDDLKPRAITRDSKWGIPVPLEKAKGKVLYVWFDAPIGYISATKEWAINNKEPDRWKDYWFDPKTKLIHFIGKDNIPFHTIFFPAMIMGQNKPYKLPDNVPANEFLMLEKRQFSKSDGWYIDLEGFFKKYSTDQIRYYLAANAPETSDSDFSWKDFQNRCNGELLGKFGNYIHRTFVFAKNNCDQKIPAIKDPSTDDKIFIKEIKKHIDEIDAAYSEFSLRKASSLIMELAQTANVYFDNKKPWVLAKDPSKKDEMNTTIAICLNCIKALALVASPIIPYSAQKIWNMLGFTSNLSKESWGDVKNEDILENQKLQKPIVLFRKIEDEEIEKEIKQLKTDKKKKVSMSTNNEDSKEQILFKDFQKLDMRVGKIISAEQVENSDNLLKIIVDVGFEKRQIISGIAQSVETDSLVGTNVIIIVNMKPAKIMGIESNGMLLTAGPDDNIKLPSVEDLEPGSIIC